MTTLGTMAAAPATPDSGDSTPLEPLTAQSDPGDDELSRLETALTRIAKSLHGPRSRFGPGVDRSGYFALGRLEMCGQTRMSDLAGLLGLDPSTVSRQVRVLEELGMVARRPDPDDGRASLLDLTESGRAELASARAERHQLLERALGGWNDRDRGRLVSLLDRLVTAMHAPAAAVAHTTSTTPAETASVRGTAIREVRQP